MAVLPSADSATEVRWDAFPTELLPTSFAPCCWYTADAGCDAQSAARARRMQLLLQQPRIGQARSG
jgi:hypothetical protein